MARRSNQVNDFLKAFNSTMSTMDAVAQDFELGKIANEKPVESQGYTAEQGDQLSKAAESGAQVGINYKPDGTFDSYSVAPQGSGPASTVATQGVTDFMGNRTAGTMSESQVNNARTRAMAGVLSRTDPIKGNGLMRDVIRGEREDTRAAREDKLYAEQDAEKASAKQLDGEVGTWFESRLANPDGSKREATVDDHLAASQLRASKLMASGKVDAAGKVISEYNAQSLVKIQLDGAQRTEALGKTASALAAGDLGAVKDFYNRFIPDGAHVTDVQKGPKGEIIINRTSADGRPMPPTTMADTGQLLSALNSFKDPLALYNWSQNEFKNNLTLKADARADRADIRAGNADARAASSAAQGNSDRRQTNTDKQAAAAAGVALYKEQHPKATAAEIEAVRTGIVSAVPKVDGSAPAEVKLAQTALSAGIPGVTDMASALQWARNKSETSPSELHTSFVTTGIKNMESPKDAVTKADETMASMGYTKQGGRWANTPTAAAPGASAAPGPREAGGKVTVGQARYPEGTRLQGKPGKDGTPGKPYIVRNGEAVPL